MRVLMIVGMGVIALTTCTAFAQVAGAGAGVHPIGCDAGPSYAGIPALESAQDPLGRTTLHQRASAAVIRVGAGPAIDMDNRRQDEDIAQRRKRQKELREQAPDYTYPSGGYMYPPPGSRTARPPQGSLYPALPQGYGPYPGSGFYPYNPNITYYRDPATGLYHVYPQSVYPGNKDYSRSKE